MAVEVIVNQRHVTEIMQMVYELREQGLVQHTDFDFAHYPEVYDTFAGTTRKRHTVFTFYTEKYATWFAIKYGT